MGSFLMGSFTGDLFTGIFFDVGNFYWDLDWIVPASRKFDFNLNGPEWQLLW